MTKIFPGRAVLGALAGLAASLPAPLSSLAQSAPRYRPPGDTVWVETVNPFHMYWVRGADTVGQGPVHSVTVESRVWRAAGERFDVVTRQSSLNTQRTVSTDTTTLLPDGTVVEIGHRRPGVSERVDFILHLPSAPLAVGMAWTDSLYGDTAAINGRRRAYGVRRRLQVARIVDSLGTRVAEVRGEGTARYADAFWIDSAGGRYAWLDVAGPVHETFWFDVQRGRQLGRRWEMDLRGRGGLPNPGGGMDSVAAGLLSRELQRVVSPERAHLLLRPLPGPDTTYTLTYAPLLLHTVERSATRVRSGMARNDGLVGTAETSFGDARPVRYEATWTDTAATTRVDRIAVDAAGLRVTRGGARDTLLALPADAWGIAEYAMEEHLLPVLMRLPSDGSTHPFHVYRPTPGRWDHGTAQVLKLEGALLALLRMEGDTVQRMLISTGDGDLLFAGSADSGGERVPLPGTARRARLNALLEQLQRLQQPGRTSMVPRDR
ncbi:MAG: hypothetical protein ACJ8GN_20140 [Longimicrobiaceae bacterium]